MNLRQELYELAARHRLDARAARQLQQLAGLHQEPAGLARWLARGIAVLAVALVGFGLILWVAANWDTLGRVGRFALLQGVIVVACAASHWRPAAKVPLGLLALLGIGGLFAYFGQTYQTGADPWQLFALWALLALPLCLAARSDVLWVPWVVVAMLAISLWAQAHIGHRWAVRPGDLWVHAFSWTAALIVTAALSYQPARIIGAGLWARRMAATLAVVMISCAAVSGLFHNPVAPHYPLAIILFAASARLLVWPAAYDLYALSAVALGLNTLLVAGLARLLLAGGAADPIGSLLLLGLAAAALLAASVSAILRLNSRYQSAGESL